MAAKLLHSLTDDNIDLQKQIGCMNGIFQLFDRHHILTPKKGISEFNGNAHLRSVSVEKYSQKNSTQEKQRICSESSRASFSSLSRSSSFSSVECNKAASQLEAASFDRIIFPETPSKDPTMSLQSRDLRDLVKDSMYREIHGLSLDSTQAMPCDVKDSLGVLSRLQEAPWYHDEPRSLLRSSSYHSKDGSISRDAPRFSYDSRGDVSKSALKLKDLPRLSLDSKAGSMRSLHADSKSNFLKSIQMDDNGDHSVGNLQRQQARPPSVVAKLMGLETLPNAVSSNDTNSGLTRSSYPDKDFVNLARPSLIQQSNSSKNLWKEPSSPRWRNPDSSMKPMSRFPIEPAPWKQIDGRRSSQKPVSATKRAPPKGDTTIPSVYSEIEKRLKDLEFTQSGKDLRALKQILEAMQSKGFLPTEKDHEQTHLSSKYEPRSVDRRKPHSEQVLASTKRKTIIESPIVIMKPAKLFDEFIDDRKGLTSGRTAKDPSSKSIQRDNVKNDRTVRTAQTSMRPQQTGKDGNAVSGKSSGSISPRLQQKKLELEKRSRPPTPPDSSKSRRQPSKQQGEAHSPGGRRRPKHPNIQESGNKLSEVHFESRNSNHHENEISVHSNEKSSGISSCQSPSMKASEYMLSGLIRKNSTLALCEEESAEFGSNPLEYSSPVSVLDDIVHKDDSPSPRKTIKVSLDKSRDSDAVCGSSADVYISNSDSTSQMNRNKLQNIEKLVEKLRRLNSTHDEARTDYIASLCENTDPDHRYVSEILLASGLLLRELGSNLTNFKFHPSGHPINPELFLVLEQTKSSTQTQAGKTHRKLIFDTVNEILARKFPFSEPRSRPLKRVNAQKLLRELCCEIELLQDKCSSNEEEEERWKNILYEDVMHRSSQSWMNLDDEMSGAVLDIERSMFKDLVDEIVIGEFAGLKTKTAAGRRRLFVV